MKKNRNLVNKKNGHETRGVKNTGDKTDSTHGDICMTRAQRQQQQALSAKNENRDICTHRRGQSAAKDRQWQQHHSAKPGLFGGSNLLRSHCSSSVQKQIDVVPHKKKNENQTNQKKRIQSTRRQKLVIKQTKQTEMHDTGATTNSSSSSSKH